MGTLGPALPARFLPPAAAGTVPGLAALQGGAAAGLTGQNCSKSRKQNCKHAGMSGFTAGFRKLAVQCGALSLTSSEAPSAELTLNLRIMNALLNSDPDQGRKDSITQENAGPLQRGLR